MSHSHLYQVEDFISELNSVKHSDVLVNLNGKGKSILELDFEIQEHKFTVPFSSKLNQIYKIAQAYKKNSDVHSLCLVSHVLVWKVKEKDIKSPLFLFPLRVSVDKLKQEFHFNVDYEAYFVNPFVVNSLKNEFGIDILQILDFNEELSKTVILFQQFLASSTIAFDVYEQKIIGNFHHHRYEILKDLEEIVANKSENKLVKTILGQGEELQKEPHFNLNLSSKNCFETDTDQREIFNAIEFQNIVVQGPPGTGKSQVLANLISKLLLKDRKQLIISEKKTALDVLVKKLESANLNHFAFVFSSQSKNSDFIFHLKKTWNFLENTNFLDERNLLLSDQYRNQIQLVFDKLLGSTDFPAHTLELLQEINSSTKSQELSYLSNLPTLHVWNQFKEVVEHVYSKLEKPALLSKINPNIIEQIDFLDQIIGEIILNFEKINKVFRCESIADLENLFKKSIRLQIIENESNKKYFSLVSSKSAYKKFTKLKTQYLAEKVKIASRELELKIWKSIPSLTEIESWLLVFEKGNWFAKYSLKRLLVRKYLVIEVDVELAIHNFKNFLIVQKKLEEASIELLQLGIEKPEIELNVSDYVVKQLQAIETNELNEINNFSSSKKDSLMAISTDLKQSIQSLKTYFLLDVDEDVLAFLSLLQNTLPAIILLKKEVKSLPREIFSKLYLAKNCEEFELLVIKSNWIKLTSQFPELATFNGQKLSAQLEKLIETEEEERINFSNEILCKKKNKFSNYQLLLLKPHAKLSGEEKELKKILKIGKAILVKEFSKSKQHRSLRDLMDSEAQIWIELLCPIHLSTPTVISRNYTLKENLFEFAIFDEASQLVLPKAISCLQRAERMLIAGDSQQMSPSSFFVGKISSVDLLHQASYYLPNFHLKHHYRSIHSELIAFSNTYFYKNELIVYPSFERNFSPLNLHYIENGIFDERKNIIEARAVAIKIEALVQDSYWYEKSIGVVAFSEHQLSCIWKQLSLNTQVLLEEKIKKNIAFFKTLEQAQGEECDVLLISLAYAKDSEGKFNLRFGPLNQETGAKRLNVLFSRAKERIDFFTSVRSNEFKISTNEAINLLRKYIQDLENFELNNSLNLPFELDYTVNENQLFIKNPHKKINNVEELTTFHKMIKARFWKIKYEI